LINVEIFNETDRDLKEYKKLLREIFKNVDDKGNFSVIFVSDEQIKKLNSTYRKINEVTDVLSFPSDEEDYLGDVFIAVDKAESQAVMYNHSLNREIGFLAVHGYLHLKGYIHETVEEEKKMNELTEEILTRVNLRRDKWWIN